jgi:hypothetical protein
MTLIRFPRSMTERKKDEYSINRPLPTHWRPATCAEVNCPHYLHGFQTVVDEHTTLGQAQANYIRHDRTRQHKETRRPDGLTVFSFEPGQRGFAPHCDHKLPLEITPLFEQRAGGIALARLPFPEWADQFNDHMERAAGNR